LLLITRSINVNNLFKNVFVFLNEFMIFSTRRLRLEQRSLLANPTVVAKLQFIYIKQNLLLLADGELRNDDDVK